MKIRFTKPCNLYNAGDEIDTDKPVADLYIARGVAELVEERNAVAREAPDYDRKARVTLKG